MDNQNARQQVQLVQGNIANQPDADVVVNAANAQLTSGSGVAGALHNAAGPQLYEACKPLAPIKPGDAVITPAFKLPNRFVIHCLGPVYGSDKPEAELLSNCYKNALQLAEQHQLKTIAFPAISTGVYGYPLKDAAHIALEAVLQTLPRLKWVEQVRFVLFSSEDLKIFEEELDKM